MSEILIRGMEMPKDRPLIIKISPDGTVYMSQGIYGIGHGVATAIPVPPHGRLGDLDELEKTFREDADAEWNRFASPVNWADAFDDVANMIAETPTIIEAEEE